MIKTRTWILIFSALFAVCAALSYHFLMGRTDGRIANIYRDGYCLYSIDLAQVTDSYELTVSGDNGENVLHIEPGRICVEKADCPDQVCVNAGWLSDSVAPIVCLPHRLVIRLEKNAADAAENFDGLSR